MTLNFHGQNSKISNEWNDNPQHPYVLAEKSVQVKCILSGRSRRAVPRRRSFLPGQLWSVREVVDSSGVLLTTYRAPVIQSSKREARFTKKVTTCCCQSREEFECVRVYAEWKTYCDFLWECFGDKDSVNQRYQILFVFYVPACK